MSADMATTSCTPAPVSREDVSGAGPSCWRRDALTVFSGDVLLLGVDVV
jgi:hypothetical protein